MNAQEKLREIRPDDENFPVIFSKLSSDSKPPNAIFARDSLDDDVFREIFSAPSVAIVGSRKPTDYGKRITLELSRKLAENGITVISGLALGHDALAHRGCMDGGGKTIAVLGTPIDRLYPARNLSLAKEILTGGGAIISEIQAGAEAGKDWHARTSFLARNRIISALADVVIVVEANMKSGSLSTARHAKKQGRAVMAIPGNITSPLSAGTNKLLAEGAKICLGAEDVLDVFREFFPEKSHGFPKKSAKKRKKSTAKTVKKDDSVPSRILAELSRNSLSTDELLRKIPESNAFLTLLEIEGEIAKNGDLWQIL